MVLLNIGSFTSHLPFFADYLTLFALKSFAVFLDCNTDLDDADIQQTQDGNQ